MHISIISLYIPDIAENKGGLMIFIKSHILSRRLNNLKIPSNIPQIIPFEINLRKKMLSCSNLQRSIPEKQMLTNLLEFY